MQTMMHLQMRNKETFPYHLSQAFCYILILPYYPNLIVVPLLDHLASDQIKMVWTRWIFSQFTDFTYVQKIWNFFPSTWKKLDFLAQLQGSSRRSNLMGLLWSACNAHLAPQIYESPARPTNLTEILSVSSKSDKCASTKKWLYISRLEHISKMHRIFIWK